MTKDREVLEPLKPSDFDVHWEEGKVYPFVESENAQIMAYGHWDKEDFANLVLEYDESCNPGGAEKHAPEDIEHRWAVHIVSPHGGDEDGWYVSWGGIEESTPKSFPMTIICR